MRLKTDTTPAERLALGQPTLRELPGARQALDPSASCRPEPGSIDVPVVAGLDADGYDASRGELIDGVPAGEQPGCLQAAVERAAEAPPKRLPALLEEALALHSLGRFTGPPKRLQALRRGRLLDSTLIITGRGLWLLRLIRADDVSPSRQLAANALDARAADGWAGWGAVIREELNRG